MIRLLVAAAIVLAIATPAAAQTDVADALIPPDAFPDLVLVADEPIDDWSTLIPEYPELADNPELVAQIEDLHGWMRGWHDPESDDVLAVMAISLDATNPEAAALAAMAGAQSEVPLPDRSLDSDHENVVLLDLGSQAVEPTLAASFADGQFAYMLVAAGADPAGPLDRLIEEQLDRVTSPLVPQHTFLAETFSAGLDGKNTAERAGEITGQVFGYAAVAGLAWWLWRRHRRKKAQSYSGLG